MCMSGRLDMNPKAERDRINAGPHASNHTADVNHKKPMSEPCMSCAPLVIRLGAARDEAEYRLTIANERLAQAGLERVE